MGRDNMASQPPPYPGHEKSPQGFPGQQYMPPPQPGQPQAPVMVQHQYVAPRMFGPNPIDMECPNCRAQQLMRRLAFLLGLQRESCVLLASGAACVSPFAWTASRMTHKCPSCNAILGRYKAKM